MGPPSSPCRILVGPWVKRFSGYRVCAFDALCVATHSALALSDHRTKPPCSRGPPAPAPRPTLQHSSIALFDIAFAFDVNAPPDCMCKSKRSFPPAVTSLSFRYKLVACPNQAPSVDRTLSCRRGTNIALHTRSHQPTMVCCVGCSQGRRPRCCRRLLHSSLSCWVHQVRSHRFCILFFFPHQEAPANVVHQPFRAHTEG